MAMHEPPTKVPSCNHHAVWHLWKWQDQTRHRGSGPWRSCLCCCQHALVAPCGVGSIRGGRGPCVSFSNMAPYLLLVFLVWRVLPWRLEHEVAKPSRVPEFYLGARPPGEVVTCLFLRLQVSAKMASKLNLPTHFRNWNASTERSINEVAKSSAPPPPSFPKPLWKRPWFIGAVAAVVVIIIIAIAVPLAVLLPKKGHKHNAKVMLPLYIYPKDNSTWGPLYESYAISLFLCAL